ncbi:MAG: SPASM domain-containing protein [Spirochaetales bacterium]|nr:SPASM domain-containing protein [Spirochaetales bacterium]
MEVLFQKIHTLSKSASFHIKLTEGQHYRRFYRQKEVLGDFVPPRGRHFAVGSKPVNSGLGFCFVSHTGSIQPSGFVPLDCGNVRTPALADVYRNHQTFRDLLDLSKLTGKCQSCEYRDYCSGGSRARTFATTGDYLGSEVACAYRPG